MSAAKASIAFVMVILVLFAGVRLADYSGSYLLEFGGGISYLAATGHEEEYGDAAREHNLNRWHDAEFWRDFIEPTADVPFEKIQLELTTTDIHPPLYFWALAILLTHVSADIGGYLILNLLFSVLTILLFYRTATLLLPEARWTLFATALFAFNPIMISPFISLARQYELLQLFVVAAVYFSLREILGQGRSALNLTGVALAFFFGLMTQVQFVLLIACILLVALICRGLAPAKKLAFYGMALLAVMLFTLLNSEFIDAFMRYRNNIGDITLDGALERARRVIAEFGKLAGIDVLAFADVVYLLVPLVFVPLLVMALRYVLRTKRHTTLDDARLFVVLASLGLVSVTVLQYLSFNSPIHAIGGRYFYLFWPLLALAVVILLRSAPRLANARVLMPATLCWLVAVNAAQTVEANKRYEAEQAIHTLLQSADRIVMNNPGRGRTARLLPNVTPDADLFVADSSVSQQTFSDTVATLAAGDAVILSNGSGIADALVAQQRQLVAAHWHVDEVHYGGLQFLRLRERAMPQPVANRHDDV